MSGGRSETSEHQATKERASPTDELAEALDRLKRRISDVAEWAEHASFPEASPARGEPEVDHRHTDAASFEAAETESREPPTLVVIRSLRNAGAIANGVFTSGGELTELDPVESDGRVSVSGMVALLDLIPPQTVLEVRTTAAEWRAARVGDDAFALELSGDSGRVDQWLATLLSPERD